MPSQQQQSVSGTPSSSSWYTSGGSSTPTIRPTAGTAQPRLASAHTQWPDAVAYREAMQNPHTSLAPLELRDGTVHHDRRMMPAAYSGRFAVVFRVTDVNQRAWALRCFTIPPQQDTAPRSDRYRLIASHVSDLGDDFVPFQYFDQGVRVGQTWFPVVAMRWAAGETLGKFTDRNLHNPEVLRTLAGTLSGLLARLEAAGIAHGDWQHDNLLISEDGKRVTLVDYDGMFVPELAGLSSDENGHPNYQHPGRTPMDFGPGMDRFPCLVMQSALLALAHEPGLWARFSDGESLLFKKADFIDPSVSPVFRALREVAETHHDELLADSLARLSDACHHAPETTMEPAVPAVEHVLAPSGTNEWDVLPTATTIISRGRGANEETVVSLAPTGTKWWLSGPAINLPTQQLQQTSLAGQTTSKWFASQSTARAGTAQAQRYSAPADTFAFIERVWAPESLAAERKHFAGSRCGVAVLTIFTILFLASLFGHGVSFPFYLFFWVFNLGSLGYANWPRKKIYDELEAEIAKMEKQMNDRREKIASKKYAFSAGSVGRAPAASFATLHDFVADRLGNTAITKVFDVPGITLSTLRSLKNENIETVLQLQGRTSVSGVPTVEMLALQDWCRNLEMKAADEYRLSGSGSRGQNQSAEIARWEQEAAEFERERDRLLREKSLFPDVSFWSVYWRRLMGLPETSQTPTATP